MTMKEMGLLHLLRALPLSSQERSILERIQREGVDRPASLLRACVILGNHGDFKRARIVAGYIARQNAYVAVEAFCAIFERSKAPEDILSARCILLDDVTEEVPELIFLGWVVLASKSRNVNDAISAYFHASVVLRSMQEELHEKSWEVIGKGVVWLAGILASHGKLSQAHRLGILYPGQASHIEEAIGRDKH